MTIEKIICGDCIKTMKRFPDGCIDLVVTSPPYDNLRKYKGYVFDFEKTAQEIYRIMKDMKLFAMKAVPAVLKNIYLQPQKSGSNIYLST